MKSFLRVLVAAGVLAAVGNAASAATFNLEDQYRYASKYSHLTVSDDGIKMKIYGYNDYQRANVSTAKYYGLSVQGHMIDGRDGREMVYLGFSELVNFKGFKARYTDRHDQYKIFGWNGSSWDKLKYGSLSGYGGYGSKDSVWLTGSAAHYASKWYAISTVDYNDDFKIRKIKAHAIPEIPLPATGLMLLTALGALGLRRRKT